MTQRFVVATAGHVDHGKSTLVRALTGIEPDRFAEERRRGLTIDLGFAWTTLASGRQLAFVDVPGHERFIGNMLTGLGPAPAVLFVVAADEGWRRQSGEHLAAATALQVRHGLLAVTRSDLADPAAAEREARTALTGTSLADIPAVAVSGVTNAGVSQLRTALDELLERLPEPDPAAPLRLWLDRSFSVRGTGTVVTGTLASGRLEVGDSVELNGRSVVVRGLQSAGADVESIGATARVAVNLRGVDSADVARGDALLTPDTWTRTTAVDVRLDVDPAALPAEVILHVGTAAVPVHVRPLDAAHARLALARPLPVRAGDRAVLRDPGRHAIAGGVLVLDADPPSLARRGAARSRASELSDYDGQPDADTEIARRGVVPRVHLDRLGIDTTAVPVVAGWLVAPDRRTEWIARAPLAVARWAEAHPLDPAMPAAAFARTLGLPDDHRLVAAVARDAGLDTGGGRVSMPGRRADLGAIQPAVDAVCSRLAQNPFDAPTSDELRELGLGRREIAAAVRAGILLNLDGVLVRPDVVEAATAVLRDLPAPFTLSAARQAMGTTRRVAVPLLEHLDALGRTRPIDASVRVVTDDAG